MNQRHHFCSLCPSANLFTDFRSLFLHVRNEHREESPFTIRCELSVLCGSRYSSFDSYRLHLYRCHRDLIISSDDDATSSNDEQTVNDRQDLFSHLLLNDQSNSNADFASCLYEDEELDEMDLLLLNFQQQSLPLVNEQATLDKISLYYTRFLLELREHHLLPQKIVQSISSGICNLFDMILEVIKMKDISSVASTNDLQTIFTNITDIINSISKNEYTFLKKCESFFDYQPPKEIVLNNTEDRAYYIPIKEGLLPMLRNGELIQSIMDNVHSLASRATMDKDLILSNRQCRSNRSKISHQNNSNVLLLKLYTDGIGITNPIGPKRDSHKLTCFYYLLDDLPDTVRSQVNSIGLYCIAYTKHLHDENSRDTLMNVLVRDLNQLQNEGITVPGFSSRIYFAISVICADNLAANEVGGFQKNFSSGNFCRHCYITYEQRHIPLTDISFVPRTRLKHDIIVNKLMTTNENNIQGVNNQSWFKELIGFHPTESLPPDLMHDTAEGNTPRKCKRTTFYGQIDVHWENEIDRR